MNLQAFLSRRVVTSRGIHPAGVLVQDGRILDIVPPDQIPARVSVKDFGDAAMLPGLVDSHVHGNEPGRTEWEGFQTATRAAAAGGITTLVDMPLNCIPVTTTLAALETKLAALNGSLAVDVGFWGGVVPGNAGELSAMAERGMLGAKCFLCHSGIDDFPRSTEEDLRLAMPV